jgi:amino acid adenylation domain-containing protein
MRTAPREDASPAAGGREANPAGGLYAAFARSARSEADAAAVTCGVDALTYRELDARANGIAHHLVARGVEPGALVGIFLDRSLDLVAGILGILKAGAAYVPLDPVVPAERLAFMLSDSGARVVLTSGALASRLPDGPRLVRLDAEEGIERTVEAPPNAVVGPESLAYVIYTSGSTGVPKGTLVTHGNVQRLFRETESWFHFGPKDVWTLFHSPAFDFSVWEIWGALLYGGRLVVVPYAVSRSPRDFHALLRDEGVTVLNQTPSAFRQLARVAIAHPSRLALRTVVFGGEALNLESLRPWFERFGDERPRLVNMYGITETTVHVTYRPIARADLAKAGVSPIGVPIPDLDVLLLDENLLPVPPGSTGEIVVAGGGVALGYLNRPELTSARFIVHEGRRVYRSGDLGRLASDGDLEYLGRMDDQVKIRGFRVELGEVETVLRRQSDVMDAAVLAVDGAPDEKRLVAWVVLRPGAHTGDDDLRARAAISLPEYMLPAAFIRVDAIPLTANGKVDRAALPAPTSDRPQLETAFAAPASEWEERLTGIWSGVLRVPRIGRRDNFFDLGGSSLLAAEIHEEILRQFGRDLPATALFEHPTIETLARLLEGAAPAGAALHVADRARRQREAAAASAARRSRG